MLHTVLLHSWTSCTLFGVSLACGSLKYCAHFLYCNYYASPCTLFCCCCSVKQRMDSEEGMSCAEFLYPVFQGYDFLQLHQQANCWMQVYNNNIEY